MERLRVMGGARLTGRVRVPGAKNSALKLMAAALLAEGETRLGNLPRILDVEIMAELLSSTYPPIRGTRPTTTWSGGCAPRSRCWGRCWPAAGG
jgi:UDP-N-acetylglucosamine enolpyruvyl transferase